MTDSHWKLDAYQPLVAVVLYVSQFKTWSNFELDRLDRPQYFKTLKNDLLPETTLESIIQNQKHTQIYKCNP